MTILQVIEADSPLADWIASAFRDIHAYLWHGGADEDLRSDGAQVARVNVLAQSPIETVLVAVIQSGSAVARVPIKIKDNIATIFHKGEIVAIHANAEGGRFVRALRAAFREAGRTASSARLA